MHKRGVQGGRGELLNRVGEPTFAEAVVNSEVAPIPAVRETAIEPRGSAPKPAFAIVTL